MARVAQLEASMTHTGTAPHAGMPHTGSMAHAGMPHAGSLYSVSPSFPSSPFGFGTSSGAADINAHALGLLTAQRGEREADAKRDALEKAHTREQQLMSQLQQQQVQAHQQQVQLQVLQGQLSRMHAPGTEPQPPGPQAIMVPRTWEPQYQPPQYQPPPPP